MSALRVCNHCGLVATTVEDLELFRVGRKHKHGRQNMCKVCSSKQASSWNKEHKEHRKEYMQKFQKNNPEIFAANEANRRYRKSKATPAWANLEKIKTVYALAAEKGLVVDHMVPIKGKTVCGLHCEDNLRCIPTKLNLKKSNTYWPDM